MTSQHPPLPIGLVAFATSITAFAWFGAPRLFAETAAPGKPLAVGSRAPDFELRDLDGKPVSLAAHKGEKATVIAFFGVSCPAARYYAPRLEELYETYGPRGVAFFGINANVSEGLRDLRGYANEHGVRFPLLKDPENKVADLLGATRMVEMLVLDGQKVCRYRGRVDDQYALTDRSVGVRKGKVEAQYLEDAIAAVIEGKSPPVATTDPLGCVIGREARVTPSEKTPTFHADVEPILQRRCQSCHRPGQIAPFSLLSYDDARGWSGMIQEVVEGRRMPPWHADAAVGVFANDRRLSESELSTLVQWVEGGVPEGDPKAAPPPVEFPEGWQIGQPDLVLEIPEAFHVPATGTVRYQYFMVDTNLPEDRWVSAMEVRAGARDVVHHILVFAMDPADKRRWRRETGGGTKGFFGAMVPGETPLRFPSGAAKKLAKGSTLIFQIHYTTNGVAREDRSKIGFIFSKEPVRQEVRTRSAVNVGIRIPPSAEAHEQKAVHTFLQPMRILSFLPHMHLRGAAFRYDLHEPATVKVSRAPWRAELTENMVSRLRYDSDDGALTWLGSMTDAERDALLAFYKGEEDTKAIEKLRAEARTETLLNVPSYDFGWQSLYVLAKPRDVREGSVLECTAVFNNSASNPALTRAQWESPVKWGDQTWEEMLIGYFDSILLDS